MYNGFPDWNINDTITVNDNEPDANGTYWTLDGDIEGWDSPDMRATLLPRIGSDPSADGEIPSDLHYRGRTLSFKMVGASPSDETRRLSQYLLSRAVDLVDGSGTFTGNEEIPKQLTVVRFGNSNQGKLKMANGGFPTQLSQTPGWEGLGPGATAYLTQAEVELYATDPRKYATSFVITDFDGGVATIDNVGNTATQNVLIVLSDTGGGEGPITLTSSAAPSTPMRLLVPTIPVGAPALPDIPSELFVNLSNKTIVDNSDPPVNYYYLRSLQTPWISVPPGTSTITVSPAQAGAVWVTSAWI